MLKPLRTAFSCLVFLFALLGATNAFSQIGCGGFNGAPQPTGGPQSLDNGELCLNKVGGPPAKIRISAFNVADGNNPNNFAVEIDWDDGSARQIVAFGGGITVNHPAPHDYDIPLITHVFLPRPCAARPGAECAYRPRVFLRIAGVTCPAQFGTSPDFFRFNTDDQCSGNMRITETVTNANIFEVCAGASTAVTFTDRTTLNCLPPEELTGLNFYKRWRSFQFGTFNNITGGVTVGGVPVVGVYTPPGMPEVSTEPLSVSSPPFANNTTAIITIPATAQVGEEFHIRMNYWNYCNQLTSGDAPVFREGIIRIVDQPTPPTPVDQDLCNGVNPAAFRINFAAASSAVLWFRDNAGVPGAFVANPSGANSKTFPTAAYPTGAINNTVAGVYRMWASYRAQVGAGALLCESILVPVLITIRGAVPVPGPISGTAALCNGSTGVAFSVPIPASALAPGGPTTYTWDVVNAANVVVADVTLTPSSGQNAVAQNITADFSIAPATFGGAGTIVRKIRIRRSFVNSPFCQSTVVEFPVTVSRATDKGTMSGGGIFCQGSNLGNVTWNSPGFGNILSWEIATAVGGPYATVGSFGTSNPVAPNSLALTPGNYFIRAQVKNGTCPQIPTDPASFTINPNPDIAAAGPDDAICVPAGVLTYPAFAANTPSVGVTSTWAQVSGPGTSLFSDATAENSSVTVSAPGIYVFSWTLNNGSCVSVDNVQISIGRNPALPIPTPADFCGLTGTLGAVAPVGGEIIAWSLITPPAGGTASIANPNQIPTGVTVNIPGVYRFQLTFSSGSCPTQSAPVDINFYPPATSAPEIDKTVCVDGNGLPAPLAPFGITGTVGGGATSGRWEITTGSGTFLSSGAAIGNAVLGATINDSYIPSAADHALGSVVLKLVAIHPQVVCGNVSNDFTVTFDKKPALAAVVGSPFDVCGTTASILSVTPTQGGSGIWTVDAPAGQNITDPNNISTTVTNLVFGANAFRWTVSSALGVCAPSDAVFTINRTTAPLVNNLNITNLCETNANTGIAQGVDLATSYDALITGPAPGVTVSWFRNAARTVPVPNVNNEDVSNTETFYIRVTTSGIPPCSSDGVVNFTINSKPFVANLNPSLCEEVMGGGMINNVDLTTNDALVALATPNRTVTWFTDITLLSPVATPTDVDNIADGATFYARVENTVTTCFNTAEVIFNVNAIPADNPIIGPNAVCLDPNAVIFFTVTTFHPGHTYQWTVPGGVTVANGSTTDFFLLLKFPAVIPGGIDVQVVETSPEGCPGNPQMLHVDIEDQPGSLVISGPAEVCEFETDVIFTVPLFPNITYAWNVPAGASIILGQGSEEVHINFGNIAGDVTVTPSTTNGCVGPLAVQPVAINRRPVMANLDKTVCSQEDAAITLAVAGGSEPATSYHYISRVLDAGLFTLNAPTTPPQASVADNVLFTDKFENKTVIPLNVRYTVSGISVKGCEGPSGFATLRVNPEPQLDPLLGKSICSDEITGITLVSAANTFPADRFIITNITVPAGVAPASAIPVADGTTLYLDDVLLNNKWTNTTGVNQTVSYFVLPYSTLLGCAGAPPTPVTVTIFPRTDVVPVSVLPLCNGDLLNVPFSSLNNPDASFFWSVKTYDNWVIVGSPAAGVGNIANLALNNTSLTQDGTVTFEVYGKNPSTEESPAGCANPVLTFVVTILKSPEANAQNITVCSDLPGGNTYTADLASLEPIINTDGTPNIKFVWYVTDPTLGPATAIPTGNLSSWVMGDNIPVFVEVTYLPTGCKKVVPVKYTVNPNVSVSSLESDYNGFNLNCNNDNSGEIRVDVLTGTPVYAYRIDGGPFINAGAVTYSFKSLAAGNHTVEVQDSKGCIATHPVTLVEPPPLLASLNIDQPITCFLGQDGIISTTRSGGTGTYPSYLLLQTNTVDPNNDGIFPNLGAGTYNVRLTDSNGCKVDTNPITLSQPTQVDINSVTVAADANGFNLSCRDAVDGEIAVTFSGGNVPPAYTITMIKSSDPLNPLVNSTAGFNTTFTNLGFGNYSIVAKDGKGCPSLPASAIIVNPPPFSPGFVGINQSICLGDDPTVIQQLVPAFGGVGNYQYQWQFSLTGSMIDADWVNIPAATSTTYDPGIPTETRYYRRVVQSVSSRTGIACQTLGKDNIVQVLINPLPVVSFNAPSEVCQGESFSLQLGMTGGTAPIEYDYSSGATTFLNLIGTENTAIPVSNFQQPQSYTLLRVKDLNGCLAANVPQTVNVDIIKLNPDFTVLAPVAQCSGGIFTFQWVAEAGVKYTWIWSDGQQKVINPGDVPLGTNTITHIFTSGSTAASTIYPVRLQAENALCAPKFATKPVTVYPSVVLNILPGDPILCSGESITFIDQSNGVDVGKWYYHVVGSTDQLDVKAGPVPDITYVMLNNTTTNPILYEVVYEASNNEGCMAEYRKEVKVYRGIAAGIAITPDPPTPFTGGISTVDFINTSGPLDANDFEYTWDFGDVRADPPTGTGILPITVDYFAPGIKDIRLTAVNIQARTDNKTCESVALKKINIVLPMLAAAFKATPLASCFPVDITVENLSPGADTFLWELFNESGLVTTSNLRNPVFRILSPGVYDIYLTASFYATGQTAQASQKGIEVFDVPTALFEMRPNPLYVPDTELQTFNQSARATQYLWDFDDGSTSDEFQPRHLYKLEGKYNVELIAGYDHGNKDIDGDGILDGKVICYDTIRHELVAQDGGFIKLPNAFTPSSNGSSGGIAGNGTFNDVFLPIARGVEEFQMQIFDRWGNLLFESQDRNVGWDGYDRNKRLMPAGVYVYKLTLRLSNGQRTTKVGDVTLIR